MCLIKSHQFPKISFRPVKVYKVAHLICGNYYTYYEMYRISFRLPLVSRQHWIKGIFKHSITSEGVHAFLEKPDQHYFYSGVFLEAEIPPFTPYWIGTNGDVAAAKLKIIKK